MKKILTVITLASVGFLAIQSSAWAGCSSDAGCSQHSCPTGKSSVCIIKPGDTIGRCHCRKSNT